jgi:nitrate/nitrite transporter NarK
MQVSNTQFSLLEASEDFMATLLLLISGVLTDRIGGAEMIIYGNIVYTLGSILVAAATTVRSFNFMIGGRVILALGDIATQIAQYKMFSSWFPPSNGFASTLGFELAIGKIGGFVGKSTANVIAKVRISLSCGTKVQILTSPEHRKLCLGFLDHRVHEHLHELHYSRLLVLQPLLQ